MRDDMNDSGELWNANVSERPARVEDVPRGSWGGGLGISCAGVVVLVVD